MRDINDPSFVWVPEKDFTSASGIVQVYRNRWWTCHPETSDILFVHVGLRAGRKASLADASPQCNASQEIAFMLMEKAYPWAAIRHVPLVLKPINVRDYALTCAGLCSTTTRPRKFGCTSAGCAAAATRPKSSDGLAR